MAVEVAAQAKVNLRLRILARETSGYHQLETLFLRLDLADTVRVRRTSGPRSLDIVGDADVASIGPTEKNLAWRAAEAYLAASGMHGGFSIELTKRIPIGGGLGGGSADAGAVLRALDAMHHAPVGNDVLLSLAAKLGADVPFLTTEHTFALAWGRGERMLALPPLPPRDVLLIIPPFAINTAEAFGWLAEVPMGQPVGRGTDAGLFHADELTNWDVLRALAWNDFELAVQRHHPEIELHIDSLRPLGCSIAMMSGSGSTVFGVWTSPPSGSTDAVPSGIQGNAKYLRTQTAARVEQVSVIE